jgi:polyribonucleotide nucleotidyltransferase
MLNSNLYVLLNAYATVYNDVRNKNTQVKNNTYIHDRLQNPLYVSMAATILLLNIFQQPINGAVLQMLNSALQIKKNLNKP